MDNLHTQTTFGTRHKMKVSKTHHTKIWSTLIPGTRERVTDSCFWYGTRRDSHSQVDDKGKKNKIYVKGWNSMPSHKKIFRNGQTVSSGDGIFLAFMFATELYPEDHLPEHICSHHDCRRVCLSSFSVVDIKVKVNVRSHSVHIPLNILYNFLY